MADIINLRLARKRKGREAAARMAAENRARFGINPAERRRRDSQAAADDARLEGLRRENTPDPDDIA